VAAAPTTPPLAAVSALLVGCGGAPSEHRRHPTEVVGVLVGDPHGVETAPAQITPERIEQVGVPSFTRLPATRPRSAVAGVDEHAPPIRQLDEHAERLPHIVEVHGHRRAAAA